MRLLERFRAADGGGCRCEATRRTPAGVADPSVTLHVDADECPGEGSLATAPDCRATVVAELAEREAETVLTSAGGVERTYDGRSSAFLLGAGRFVERVAYHDSALAMRARSDPLAAVYAATGRAGPISRIAAETGLAACAEGVAGYEDLLRPTVSPTVARGRTVERPPEDAVLRETRDLDTGAVVRLYRTDGPRDRYHLTPPSASLDRDALETLDAAATALADGTVRGGERAAGRAIRAVADDDDPVETLTAILEKHTRGNGLLDDLFADPRLTDAFLTTPAASTPVRAVVDDEPVTTNVRFSREDVETLASKVRAACGRAFSRASPTVDASIDGVRVAGVTDPASEGPGFAFRRRDDEPWTLTRLVSVGSLPVCAAGLLSLAVERGVTALVAGPRGAGKTTLLGALLWELPAAVRTVLVEDTPELPVDSLRDEGRDVQSLRVGTNQESALTPTDAVRSALRLGEGALVVGEVRGREAAALYEAMRVGAAADAVLGTIHGTDGETVRERVVADLGVPESSFVATDIVVSLAPDRRLAAIEEVRRVDDGTQFVELFDRNHGAEPSTGAIDRGESVLVSSLAGPGESYRDVLDAIRARGERIADHAEDGRTGTAATDRTRC